MRLSQLDWLSGEEDRNPPTALGVPERGEPSTSVLPRGTTTNQHLRAAVTPPVATSSPQPRPAAWRAVWISKNSCPVPSPWVRASGISLVIWESKKSLRPDVTAAVSLAPPAGQNGR